MLHEDERIDQLYSTPIQIIQSSKVFSFSLDAVLLADFANVPGRGKVIDLCSGTGIIGLFLTRKTSGPITLVEIQEKLADMAKRSVALNQLTEQVQVLNVDAKLLPEQIPGDSMDYIICNPPYFRIHEQSQKNPNPYLAIARHELMINIEDVVRVSSRLLKTNGKLGLIFRPDRLDDLFRLFEKYHFAAKRIRFIYPKIQSGKEANMVLVEAIHLGRANGVRILPPLFVYDGNAYTPEVQKLIYG